jgi:hypothetical protein
MRSNGILIAAALVLITATPVSFAQTTQRTPIPSTPPSSSPSSPTSAASGGAATQYKSEAEAKSGCGTDPVVWANPSSHVLHKAGTRYYGRTKQGAYMCEGAATNAGYHMAKNEQ